MPDYIYNNIEYSEKDVMDAASRKNMTIEDYIDKFGIKRKEKEESKGWFSQTWFGRGYEAASTTGEAMDLWKEGSNVNMETIQNFIEAKEQEAKDYVPSARMQKFQKQYEKEGKTWTAFFRGLRRDPTLMAELFVQSIGTQVGTAIDAPKEALSTAAAGGVVGGGIGFAAGGIGAVPGAIAGTMGGLAVTMETALTFAELIETELHKQDKEFTDENVKDLLEGPMGKTIRNKALGRGLTIGAIETLSGGLAGKATTSVLKGGKTAARTRKIMAAAAGVGVEAVGGGVGEVGGRYVTGQEMDPAEIGFEAITGTVTAPANVGYALLTHKDPEYHINNMDKPVTYEEMNDFIETADPIDIAKANIKIENDPVLERKAWEKQKRGIVESQIDPRVSDQTDINELVRLEEQRRKAEADTKKKGISMVPRAKEKLQTIESQIEDIIKKYEGVDRGTKDVKARIKVAKDIRLARKKILMDKITKGVKESKAYKEMDIETSEVSNEQARELFERSTNIDIN